jgi:hypothetical protein
MSLVRDPTVAHYYRVTNNYNVRRNAERVLERSFAMKLRFKVDQAECFRRGIDCPKSIVTIEVIPAEVDPQIRELIAPRLQGIDVCEFRPDTAEMARVRLKLEAAGGTSIPIHVIANGPTWDDLVEAVKKDEVRAKKEANGTKKSAEPATLKPRYRLPN